MAELFKKRSNLILGLASVLIGLGIVFYVVYEKDTLPDTPVRDHPPGFREIAGDAGITFQMQFLPKEQGEKFVINLYDHGCGVAVGDYDGDGWDDIYFVNQLGPNALYRNKGDGTFEDVTAKAGVALGDRICVGATFADTMNNGHQDLFVTSTRGGNVFFRNQGDGTFKDATKQAFGKVHVGHSQTAVFFDFDNDGYLDLLVTNTAEWTTNTLDVAQKYYPGKSLAGDLFFSSRLESNKLYRNNGDGTFTDVTAKSGLKGRGWSGDVALLDYNGDGYLDVLITNMFGPSQLYRNNGNGTFTDVTKKTLGATSYGSIGAKAFDFNNDGKLDLFLADMHSDMWMGLDSKHRSLKFARQGEKIKYPNLLGPLVEKQPALMEMDTKMADMFGYQVGDVVYGNTLFKNMGGHKFKEISDQAGMETFWPWGVAVGDFDNDGYEDVFMPAGMGYPFYYWPNYLMMNNGNETFTNRAREEGIEPPERGINLPESIGGKPAVRSSRCAATADFQKEGRLDLIVNNFNDTPYYFKNHFPRKNYIAFRLQGSRSKQNPKGSNRDAIGALVTIYMGQEVMVRQVQGAGGYLSQSSKTLHFGLGHRAQIDRMEIRWPRGQRQSIKEPALLALNQRHDIIEPAE